jgi:DNA-binding NtrC family response regulator
MIRTKTDRLNILVVDDETVVRESLASWFEEDGHQVVAAPDAQQALVQLKKNQWDLAFVDIKMPGMDGLELNRRIHELSPDTTVIIMTAFASVETAVQALREGAHDYITKPFDPEHLSRVVQNTATQRNLERENRDLKQELARFSSPTPILGESPAIERVRELIRTVGPTDTTVLITGESGTGKELVARGIHAASERAFLPLVVVNCGALPEGILESELFGHERGAFTGAQYRHKGKFEMADGSTLFLDEIGEVSPKIQVELLRVLEEKKVVRLGGTTPVTANFRTVAATNKNLRTEMEAGNFREDLYYRLNVFHIELPPLRARPEDIPVLAEAFVSRIAASMNRPAPDFDAPAMKRLREYPWPGNVRELANAIERAMVVQRGGVITPKDLPIGESRDDDPHTDSGAFSLAEMEKHHVEQVLSECDWNISQAARVLQVDRTTVYNKIKLYDLKKE